MKKVKITVIRRTVYADLVEQYESPTAAPCDMVNGMVFIANGWKKPEGLCSSAWHSMSPYVLALSSGGSHIYSDWMKDGKTAMITCPDGLHPVSYLLETLDEDVE